MKEVLDFAREHPVWMCIYLALICGAIGDFVPRTLRYIRGK